MQKIGQPVAVAVYHGLHSDEVQSYRSARVVGSYLRRDLASRRRADARRFYRVEYDDTGEIAEVREKRVRFVAEPDAVEAAMQELTEISEKYGLYDDPRRPSCSTT